MKVGILGGGQLGRMLALSGYPLGMNFRFLDPSPNAPASAVGELIAAKSFEDRAALARFADGLDIATYEFENVPAEAARLIAERVPLLPGADAIAVAQDRVSEKEMFTRLGIPTARYANIALEADLAPAGQLVGFPAVLKTRRLGYDGKGQEMVADEQGLRAAWERLGAVPMILEQLVNFQREVSLLAARSRSGESACYPLVENLHRDGILRISRVGVTAIDRELQQQAEDYGRRVLDELNYTGVLAIEFFEADGALLANEMAPRVHNTGHWSIEGAATSQFENHLRAIAGLPLGSTASRPCIMHNLIGSVPSLDALLRIPKLAVHLYGKDPLPRRKLGHVTIVDDDLSSLAAADAALAKLLA